MNRTLPLALAGLAACTPKDSEVIGPLPPGEPSSVSDDRIDANEHLAAQEQSREALDRLDALELLVVGELVVNAPEGAANCYGPCYDEADWQPWLQEHARQVERLASFVEIAEDVVAAPAQENSGYDASQAIEALNALQIVAIESVDWENDGSCYVSMCPEDFVRRDQLQRLVAGVEGL